MEPYFFSSRSYSEPEAAAKSILTNEISEITNGPALILGVTITGNLAVYERTRTRRRPQVCAVATHHQSSAPQHERPGSASRLPVSRYRSQAVERGLRLVRLYDGRRLWPHRSRCPSRSSGWTVSGGWVSGSAARGGLWWRVVQPNSKLRPPRSTWTVSAPKHAWLQRTRRHNLSL